MKNRPDSLLSLGFRRGFLPLLRAGGIFGIGVSIGSTALAVPNFSWIEDSKAAVHLTVTGSLGTDGLPAGIFAAPSSLWNVELLFGSIFLEDLNHASFADGFIVQGTFDGANPFSFNTPGGFGESYHSFPASAGDGIYRENDETQYIGDGHIEFTGSDFNDLSTWTYTFDVNIENPDYSNPVAVSEGGSTALLAVMAFVSLMMLNRVVRRCTP